MNGILLTHGAGSNADAPHLVALAAAFETAGWRAVRYNLPFRQRRPHGSPHPSQALSDREGLAEAIAQLRGSVDGKVVAGGVSYGGRQASMLAAEKRGVVDALLLLAYPLHPPGKPAQLRTAHFPYLYTPAFFVHGLRDPFATSEELSTAIKDIQVPTQVLSLERAGHELKGLDPARVVKEFTEFLTLHPRE